VSFKVKSLLPVSPLGGLLVLTLLAFAGIHMFLLAVAWLGMEIGRDFEGLYSLLWYLAVGATVLSAVLVLLRPRWIAWSLLLLGYSFTAAFTVIEGQESARERRESDQRLALERLAENRARIKSALIKADCANGITLALNRKDFSDGGSVMSVIKIPADLTRRNRFVTLLSNRAEPDWRIRGLSKDRHRLESYKSRGSHSCQIQIDAMLKELDSFAQSKTQPRNR